MPLVIISEGALLVMIKSGYYWCIFIPTFSSRWLKGCKTLWWWLHNEEIGEDWLLKNWFFGVPLFVWSERRQWIYLPIYSRQLRKPSARFMHDWPFSIICYWPGNVKSISVGSYTRVQTSRRSKFQVITSAIIQTHFHFLISFGNIQYFVNLQSI